MPTLFFLIILPVLQGIGLLIFLLVTGGIVTSYVKQSITHYYSVKAAYLKSLAESNPSGLREMMGKR